MANVKNAAPEAILNPHGKAQTSRWLLKGQHVIDETLVAFGVAIIKKADGMPFEDIPIGELANLVPPEVEGDGRIAFAGLYINKDENTFAIVHATLDAKKTAQRARERVQSGHGAEQFVLDPASMIDWQVVLLPVTELYHIAGHLFHGDACTDEHNAIPQEEMEAHASNVLLSSLLRGGDQKNAGPGLVS